MDQKVEAFTPEDAQSVETQRSWVRDHFEEADRHFYETIEGKLQLLDTIIRSNWIRRDELPKLQCLGITFGDALAQELGLEWVAVEDQYGRDPALRDPETGSLVFAMTSISKRIERGEEVDVEALFDAACETIEDLRREGDV